MAEGARLESVYTFTRIEGSNPSLTAKITSNNIPCCPKKLEFKGFRLFLCLIESDYISCKLDIVGGITGGKIIYPHFFTPKILAEWSLCLQTPRLDR